MNKGSFKKADYYYIGIIIAAAILWKLSGYPVFAAGGGVILFVYVFSWVFRIYAYWGGGQLKQIPLSEFKGNTKDTSQWASGRGIIMNYTAHADVVENGKVVGHLMWFLLRVEDGYSKKWQAWVKDHYIPVSHLKSFGNNTEVSLCYNPQKNLEIEFDTAQETWHYEKKISEY